MKRITAKTFYNFSERRKRISVDIDKHHLRYSPFKVLRIFFALKNAFPQSNISSQRTTFGFHVKAVGEDVEKISIEKRIKIREALSDDYGRLTWDTWKLQLGLKYFVETLFDMKHYPDGKLGFVEDVNPIALPWYSKCPAKKLFH